MPSENVVRIILVTLIIRSSDAFSRTAERE